MSLQTQRSKSMRHDRGSVLLIVLWILVAMSLLGISFSAAIRTEVNAARNTIDQKQSFYLARAGIEYAVFKVLESQSSAAEVQRQRQEGLNPEPDEVATGLVTLPFPNGEAEVEIADESGKISLQFNPDQPDAQTRSDQIYNLMIVVGIDPVEADAITDSILDRLDQDDFPRPNGAEGDYYQSLDPPYSMPNGYLETPEELLLIKGVTPEIYYGKKGLTETGERVEFYGLQKYFTTFVLGPQNPDVNSAPLAVLASLPFLDYDQATRIFEERQVGPFIDHSDLMQRVPGLSTEVATALGVGGPQLGGVIGGRIFSLVSRGRIHDSNVVSQIRCVIQVNPLVSKGYSVFYWNEADTEI